MLDSNSKTLLPSRFRIAPELNISGSKQFTPNQLRNIQTTINNPNLYIVDLREESHGFINDNTAISFHVPRNFIKESFTASEILEKEETNLNSIKRTDNLNIYNTKGSIIETIKPELIISEISLVKSKNINYVRLPVIDNYIPNPEIVDEFINLVKNKPSNSHLHFHCKEGEGRTTMFMSMYEMMHNNNNLSLEQILQHQQNIGGINLTNNKIRAKFLQNFYDYTLQNKSNNFNVLYSDWIKNK